MAVWTGGGDKFQNDHSKMMQKCQELKADPDADRNYARKFVIYFCFCGFWVFFCWNEVIITRELNSFIFNLPRHTKIPNHSIPVLSRLKIHKRKLRIYTKNRTTQRVNWMEVKRGRYGLNLVWQRGTEWVRQRERTELIVAAYKKDINKWKTK